MTSQADDVTRRVTIGASAETIWTHLTTEAGLLRWIGVEATADPVVGGVLSWTHENGATMVGRFVELTPHRRLVFTYGWADGEMGVGPESTTVQIDLTEGSGSTELQLTHRDLPGNVRSDHGAGWDHFLGILGRKLA